MQSDDKKIPSTAIVIISLIIGILILISLGLFVFNFKDHPISEDISDWASFATYLSGTVGLVISIATLIVTIFIAIIVRGLDDDRMDTARKFNKERFLHELREKEYAELSKELSIISDYFVAHDFKSCRGHIALLKVTLVHFTTSKKHLFSDLDTSIVSKLVKDLNDFSGALKEFNQSEERDKVTLKKPFKKLLEDLGSFHSSMQKYLLTKLNHVG